MDKHPPLPSEVTFPPPKERRSERRPASTMTTGAGIAVAAIWLAGTAATVLFAFLVFLWTPQTPGDEPDGGGVFLLLVLIAAPMIAAYAATRLIVLEDED